MGPSHQLPIKSKRENFFCSSSSTASGDPEDTYWVTPPTLGPADGLLGKLARARQLWEFYQGQLFHTSVVLGQRRRPWCDLVPSSPHSEWRTKSLCYGLELWIRTWNLFPVTPGCRSFLSCAVILLYCWSHLVSTELGLSAARLGTPEYGQIEMWIALSLPDNCRRLSGTWLFEYLEWLWIIRW